MQITIFQAQSLIDQVLSKHGYNEIEREKISEVVMYAVLRQSSQGFPHGIRNTFGVFSPAYSEAV